MERAQVSQKSAGEDARVVRTRRALQQALLSLAEEHDFADISATQIARHAGVNRNTLYLHYRDKDDLLMQTLDDLFDDLTERSRASVETQTPLSPYEPPQHWIEFMRALEQRRTLFRRLLSESGSFALASRLRAFHVEYFQRAWDGGNLAATPGSPTPDFRANFSANSSIGMVRWWLEQETDVPADIFTAWLWKYLHTLWYWDVTRSPTPPDFTP